MIIEKTSLIPNISYERKHYNRTTSNIASKYVFTQVSTIFTNLPTVSGKVLICSKLSIFE